MEPSFDIQSVGEKKNNELSCCLETKSKYHEMIEISSENCHK